MASDNEASCVSDPNFAVICSFLECFGKSCGINYPDIASLQEMLEDVHEVKQPLVDLHIKLLRKARKTVSPEKWERSLVKFCHTYSNQDGWELERFGYKKARIAVKLRLLKVLLESQFDLNPRFKLEVNKLAAEKLRVEPLGRDKTGLSYWFQLDEECNIRVYREDLDEENWELVASDRQGVVNLINSLSDGEAVPIPVNEDSNSLEISEKPIIDTGQVEDSSSPKEDTQLENNVINGAKPEIEVAKISNSKIPNKDDEGEKIIDNNANGEEDGEDEEEDDEEEEEDEEDDDDEEVSNEESSKQNSDEEEDDEEEDDEEDDDGEDEDDSQDASENQEKSRQIVTSSKIVENHVPPVVLKAKMHVAQKQAPWKAPDEITMVKITKSPAPRPNPVETTPVKAIETPVITTSPLKLVNIQDLQQPLEDRVPREEKFPSKPVLPFQTADSAMSLGKYSIKPIDKLAANLSRIQSEKLEKPGAAKLLEKIAENLARSSGAHGTLSNGDDDKLQQEFAARSLAEKSSSAGATSRNQRGMDLSTSPRGWENPADHSRPMDYSGIDLSSRKIKKPSDILASAYRAQDFQHREMDLSTRKIGKPDVANLAYDSRTVILRNHTMVTDLSKKQMYPGYEVPSGAAAYHNSARIPAKEDHRLPNYSILPDPSKIASMRMPGGALKRPLEMVDDPQQEMLKRMRAEGLTLRNPMDKRAGPLVGALRREDVVGPAIEEPVMMVQGEGSGSDCDAVNPDFGEAIEEPVIFFYGAGAGRECDTGNPGDETSSDNKESNESKKEGCSDVTTTISPTKILPGDGSDDNEASSASAAVVTKSPLKINANFSQANDTGATDNCQSTTGSSVSPKSKFKPTLGIQVIAKSSGTTPKKSSRWDVGRPENKSEECDSSIISIEGEDISKEDESISANEIQSTETNRLNAEDAQVAERKSESDDITSTSNQTFSQNKIDECSSSVGASDDGEKIQDALECQPDSSVATDTTSAIKESLETAVSEIPHCDSSVATSSSIDPSQTVESIDKGDDAENLIPSKAELEDDTSPRFFFGPNCVSYTSKAEEALANQAATSSVTHESIENAEVAKNNNNFVKIADSFNSESSDASSASNIEARLKNVEISEGKMENPSKSEEIEPPECPVQSSTSPRPIDDTDFVAAPEPMDIAIPEPSNDEKISETITTSVDVAKCQEPSECELTAQNQSDVGEDADLQATGAVKLNPEPEPSEPETVSGSIELSTEVAVKDETEKICEAEPSTSVATVETNMEVELEEKRKIQDFATPADGPSMGFSPEEESKDDDTREVSDSCDLLPAAISDETQSCTLPEIAEDSSQNPETNDDKQEESKQLEFTSDVDEKTKQSCESETEDTIAKTIENRNDKETNELCSDDAQDGFAKRSNVSEEAKDTVQSSYSDNAQPAKSDPLDDEKLESADLPEDSTGDSAAPSLTSLIVNPSGDDSSTSDHETIEPTSIPTSVGPFVEEEEIPSERVSPARIIDLNISKSPERITIESEKASSSSRLLDTLDPYTDDLSENQSSADQDSNEAMVIDDRTSDSNGSANDAIPIAEEKSLNFKDKVTPVTISTEKIEPDAECGPCEPIDSVPCESTLDVAISREKNEEIEESSNKDDGKALSDLNVDVVPNSEICEGDKSEVSEAVEAPKKDETELATTSKSKDTTAGVDDVQEKPDTSVQSSLVPNYESSEEDDVNDEVFEAETPETDELEKTPVVNEPVTDKVERLSEIVVSKSLEVSEPKTVVENKDACELKSKLNKEQPEASCENDKDFSEFEDEENDDAEEKLHIDLEEPKKNDAPTDVVEPEELPQTFTGPDKLDKRNLEINESAEVANEISEESRQLSDDVVSTSSEKGLKVSEQVKDAAEETVVDNDSKISNQIPSVIDLQLKKTVSEAEDLAIVETETFSDCPESPKPSEIVVETAVKEFKEHKREDESSTEETIVCKDTDNVVPKIDSASSKIEENVPKDDSKLEAVVDDPVREEIHKNPESLSEVQEETESCEKPESLSDIQNRDEIHEKPESLSAIQDRDEVHEKPESLSTIQDGDEIHEKPDSLSKIQEQDEIPEKSESLSKIQDRDEIPEKSESLSKIQDREDTSEEPESLSKTQDAEDTQEKPESLSEIKDRNEPHEKSEMLSNLHVQEENFEKPDSLSRIQHQEQIPEEPESLCKIQDQKETHENPESLSEVKNQEETQEKSESLSKIQDREEIPEIPELLSKTQTQDDSKTVTVEKVSPITEVASKILEKPDEPEEPDKISSTNLLPLPEISVKSKEQIGNAESSANLEANLLPNAEANLSPEKPKESLIPEREEIEAVALKSESKKEASKRLHGVLDVEDFPPTKSKPPNVDISKEDNNTDIEKKTLAVNDEKTKIDEKSVVASAGTPAQVVTAFASLVSSGPTNPPSALQPNIENLEKTKNQDVAEVTSNFVKSSTPEAAITEEKSSEIQNVDVKYVDLESDDSMGIENDSMFDTNVDDVDPLACTEEDLNKPQDLPIASDPKVGIRVKPVKDLFYEGWKLDSPDPPPVPVRATASRKRRNSAHESNTDEGTAKQEAADDGETGGKRMKLRGKRSPDMKLRKSVEQSRTKSVSSEDEAAKAEASDEIVVLNEIGPTGAAMAKARSERKPRGRPRGKRRRGNRMGGRLSRPIPAESATTLEETPVELDGSVKAAKPSTPPPVDVGQDGKKKRKKRKMVLGLEIGIDIQVPESQSAGGRDEVPVRQSRRIAQLKIKEEADKRRIEEETIDDIKGKKDRDGSDKKKRKKQKPESEEEPEVVIKEVEREVKTKKKRKKKKSSKFNEANPWQSSSGSSTEEEHQEDEDEDEIESEGSLLFKSDHEFSPESDLEKDEESEPLRRARTAQKAQSDVEEAEDEYACQKCGKADHPEWILLCDTCDKGWHCSCLRPALMLIPEGDWFCPPCQHTVLVNKLRDNLKTFDMNSKKHENEVLRKKRLAYVGISLDNVLHKSEGRANDQSSRGSSRSDDSSSSSSESSSSSSSSEESEPVYQLRERRCANTYKFNEYDDMINAAIQAEVDHVRGAGNQGRGKDIATIVNAEKEEAEAEALKTRQLGDDEDDDTKKSDKDSDEDYKLEKEDADEDDEDRNRKTMVRKGLSRKKHRKLNSLDISSEDDPESDEDFKGSSSDEEEDFDDQMESSDDSYAQSRRRGRKGEARPVRRSTRAARKTRYDEDFINDDSDDSDRPKRKKSRSVWDGSDSEDSDNSWRQKKKKSRTAPTPRFRAKSRTKTTKKKKRKRIIEPDNASDNEDDEEAEAEAEAEVERKVETEAEAEAEAEEAEIEAEAELQAEAELGAADEPEVKAQKEESAETEQIIAPFKANPSIESENVAVNENHDAEEHQQDNNIEMPIEDDEERPKKKKKESTPKQKKGPGIRRKIIYGGLHDEGPRQEEETLARRTRGRKINYQDIMGSDSEEELKKVLRKTEESEDEFVVHEGEDPNEEAEKDSDSGDIYSPKKDMPKGKAKSPKAKKLKKSKSPGGRKSLTDNGTPKERKKPGPKPGSKNRPRQSSLTLSPIGKPKDSDSLTRGIDMEGSTMSATGSVIGEVPEGSLTGLTPEDINALDDEDLEQMMMEDEEYGRRQLELAAIEIARKKQEEREAKKLEKARLKALEILAAEQQQQQQRDPNAPEGTDGEVPKKKKRGRRSKAEILAEQMRRDGVSSLLPGSMLPTMVPDSAAAAVSAAAATIVSPNVTPTPTLPTVVQAIETARSPETQMPIMALPDGQLFSPDGSPIKPKRRGRGKGKKTLALEAARAAEAAAKAAGDIGAIGAIGITGTESNPEVKTDDIPNVLPTPGSSTSGSAPPTPPASVVTSQGLPSTLSPNQQPQPQPQQSSVYPALPPSQQSSVITRMLQSQPVSSAPQSFTAAAAAMGHKYFGAPTGAAQMMPGPRATSTYEMPPRGRIPSPYRQPGQPSPMPPHFAAVRSGTPPMRMRLPGAQLYHTPHHPMDPSPSGGGPISINSRDRSSPLGPGAGPGPAMIPPAAGSPLAKGGPTPPPPPYVRGGPALARFPDNPQMAPRHQLPPFTTPASANHNMQQPSPPPNRPPGNFSPYHPPPPPNYHYGAYPPPPPMTTADDAAAYQGSPYSAEHFSTPAESQPQIQQPQPPPQPQPGPQQPHANETPGPGNKQYDEEGTGEFGGLVSYFSSQREDDLDS